MRTCLLTLGLLTGYVAAQVTTADVVGRVTDASGAVVPSATVKLANQDTNVAREITANESGDFVFNLLPPGRYSLRVEKAGFKVYNVQDITLAAGDRTRADAQMAVGAASETVQVTAEAAALQTDSSSLGTSVTGKLVQDLPL